MQQSRLFAFDAVFTVAYIALSAALAISTATLFVLHMVEVPFTQAHWTIAALNVIGALALPFAPRLYRKFSGLHYTFTRGVVPGETV